MILAGAFAAPRQEEGQAPPDIKIDIRRALTLAEAEFKDEEKTFVRKIELRKATEAEKKANGGTTWVWQVDLLTFHAGHWGPGGAAIDALTGKILVGSTHDHK